MTENVTPLREFLQSMTSAQEERGGRQQSVHGYVLRRGRSFGSESLTREEQRYIDRCGWPEHERKQRYHNTQVTALTMPEDEGMTLLYAEGFVGLGMGYGVLHAWLSLNGKVVDTTIRIDRKGDGRDRPMGVIPEGWEYYGVELDPRECLHSLEHSSAGPLIDDWTCGWPLLKRDAEVRAA